MSEIINEDNIEKLKNDYNSDYSKTIKYLVLYMIQRYYPEILESKRLDIEEFECIVNDIVNDESIDGIIKYHIEEWKNEVEIENLEL